MQLRTTKGGRARLAFVAAVVLTVAACGDDDTGSGDTVAAGDTAAAVETTAAGAETTAAGAETTAAGAETTAATSGEGGNIQASGECGLGTGEEATGDPIKIGGIATNVPGIDFTWITGMTKAYFDCVNDNGGINGQPIEYIAEEEQVDPQQIASLATKLIDTDGVLGLVGNTSVIDCGVNGEYYATQGFSPIIAGVDQACFTSPNFSAVNMGPYYSSLGGAQAALRAGAEGTIVVVSPNSPGFDVINSGVTDFAEENGMKGVSILEDVPINDPAGLAQRVVQEAGDGGAVVLDFTGPAVLPLLQAIEQQGLIDSVIWASSTPPNDPSLAAELSSAWDEKFLINAEFNLLDSGLPDQNHMNEVREEYAPDVPSSSFAQMGYLAGRIATDALLSIDGEITKESVNEAFRAVTNFSSDILCKPWYYDSTVGQNVSNNWDLTVAPSGGKIVKMEDCFEIADLPNSPLDEIRAKEAELGLNVG
ncbi:MAG: ABC transporter substrate-binding protein [Acidimicrobiia bacterium]